MAPTLNTELGNVILSNHAYGGWNKYNSTSKLTAYIAAVRAAGLSLIIGEYGYTYNGSAPDVNYVANTQGADAVFAVADSLELTTLWWHGTHGDDYSLAADGKAFFRANPGATPAVNTSDGGQKVWNMTH